MPHDTLPTLNEGNEPPLGDSLSDVPAITRVSAAWNASADRLEQPAAGPVQAQVQVPGYEILGELGRGGMGVVYKARHTGLNRIVALKMVLSGAHASGDDLMRFRTEAEAIARLQHPYIVQVYDIGNHEGRPYFSLEYCDGGSLERALRQRPLEPREAARLVEQLAEAMHVAHERGIIHRDLKPANMLLQGKAASSADIDPGATVTLQKGIVPKITDFGLAKKLDEASQTASGAVMGTPSYMAPEQACGDTKMFGPHTDVYALGAILYQCLTGRPPFNAATAMETLMQVLHGEAVPPSELQPSVPRDLETICLKCLQKTAFRRYRSAGELAADLRRFREGEPIQARPTGRIERVVKWCRRRPTLASMLLVGFLAIIGVMVAGVIFTESLQRERDTALAAQKAAETAQKEEEKAKQQAVKSEKEAIAAKELADEEHKKSQQAQRERAIAEVKPLLDGSPQTVPTALKTIEPFYDTIAPTLREKLDEKEPADKDSPAHARWLRHRTRAALAVLPHDPSVVSFLRKRLIAPSLPPDEMALLLSALAPHANDRAEPLWGELDRPGLTPAERFRVLVALATFDPQNSQWAKVVGELVDPLLASNSLHIAVWSKAVEPVKDALYMPLAQAYRTKPRESDRLTAASLLVDYEANNPAHLSALIVDADPQQFALLLPALRNKADASASALQEWIDRSPRPLTDARARQQANAAAALFHLGHSEAVWKMLGQTSPPEPRSYLIQRMALLQVEPALLIGRLKGEPNAAMRQGLILALGEYTEAKLPADLQKQIVPTLLEWYEKDPDAGVHSAIDWLLRHDKEGPTPRLLDWKQAGSLAALDKSLAGKPLPKGQQWYVNKQVMTMSTFVPTTFTMGSPADEVGRGRYEWQHQRRIGRTFAMGTKEVTVAQWDRFMKAYPKVGHVYPAEFSPAADGPIIAVTWYEAVAFCRWLSDEEGIDEKQQCYPSVDEILKARDANKPVPLPADFLKRTGYRLPTEAEWECACRAGTNSARPAGSADALLERYAWYLKNAEDQAWPCGQLRPNDAGMFDMLGNAYEWCQCLSLEYLKEQPKGLLEDDKIDSLLEEKPALRGGTLGVRASKVRSAMRDQQEPKARLRTLGLRVARTMP